MTKSVMSHSHSFLGSVESYLTVVEPTVLERICRRLDDQGIAYRRVRHQPTRTSAESASARGEDLRIGAKAILMKTDDQFRLFVLSAALRIDSRAIKAELKARDLRFATSDELRRLTGLEPGAVPPFGEPILPFPLFADPSVFENERVAFNAGALTESIVMEASDYRRVAAPVVFSFATQPE